MSARRRTAPSPRTLARDEPWRPTRDEIAASVGRTVPDVIARDLRILVCGINPGLYSGAVGHHFARPGNRFWKALYGARLTPVVLSPFAERDLLAMGIGVTNLVDRATATADQLSAAELERGARQLSAKVRRYRPQIVAFLGIGAYRTAFGRRQATFGLQAEGIGTTRIWVLPNPSGLNASFPLAALVRSFRALARDLEVAPAVKTVRAAAARPPRVAAPAGRRAAPGRAPAR